MRPCQFYEICHRLIYCSGHNSEENGIPIDFLLSLHTHLKMNRKGEEKDLQTLHKPYYVCVWEKGARTKRQEAIEHQTPVPRKKYKQSERNAHSFPHPSTFNQYHTQNPNTNHFIVHMANMHIIKCVAVVTGVKQPRNLKDFFLASQHYREKSGVAMMMTLSYLLISTCSFLHNRKTSYQMEGGVRWWLIS